MRRVLGAGTMLGVVWSLGLVWFAESLPGPGDGQSAQATDAIVVLTGGRGRVDTGFQLLAMQRAEKLFVSGVNPMVEANDLTARVGLGNADLDCCLVLGYAAESTSGNATETAAWMGAQGFSSLRLVTADYHMPRSLLEFRMAMPGITIVPHAVASANVHTESWWQWRGTLFLIITEYNKFLVVLARYLLGVGAHGGQDT